MNSHARLLVAVGLLLLGSRSHCAIRSLEIARQTNSVRLRWPTNEAASKVQFAPQVPPSNGWQTLALSVQTNGTNYELSLTSGNSSRFFRLLEPGNSPPALTLVNPPVFLSAGTTTNFSFNYADADGDVLLLQITRTNILGTNSSLVPAALAGLSGASGTGIVSILGGDLPFGPTQYGLQLRDSQGNTSQVAGFTVQVTGTSGGGAPPILTLLTNGEPSSFSRPSGQFDRFKPSFPVTFNDPEGDLFRVRIVTMTLGNLTNVVEESAAAIGMVGTNGTVRVPFFTFNSTDGFGSYTVQLTGIDRNGNVGPATSRTIQLTSLSLQSPGLRLFSFQPTTGPAGTLVLLNGSIFDPQPTNHLVTLNGLEALVTGFSNGALAVLVPEGAESGPFIVRKANGAIAISATKFIVPASVRVVAESDPGTNNFTEAYEVQTGATMRLRAEVVPLTQGGDRSVDWFVNNTLGGNPTAGTISSAGAYKAPGLAPTAGVVTVTAVLRSAPTNSGSVELRIVAPTPLPGDPKLVRSAQGGLVTSRDSRTSVNIPPGALLSDTLISVREPSAPTVPPPGRDVLGAAEFLPSGTEFSSPVTVVIPLKRMLPVGATRPVIFYDPANGSYSDEGIQGTVILPGDRAMALLPHFTIAVVAETNAMPSGPPPNIASISPVSAREGDLFPVHLIGTGLAAGLQAEVLDHDGTPTTDLRVLSYLGRDSEAGVLIEVGSIPAFDSGTRIYRLRLVRSDGAFSEANLNVDGLPELRVGPGEIVDFDNASPLLLSGVRIENGGLVRVLRGALDIESTGDVVIDGRIDAAGAPGGDANLQQPGTPGPMNHGGAGGLGREDSEGFLGLDGAEPENYGRNANDAIGYSEREQGSSRPRGVGDRFPQGIGGLPGANLELSPVEILSKVAECIGSLGFACVEAAISIVEQARSVIEIAEGGGPGKRGYGAVDESPLDETGGGGGGGGGLIEITVNVADLLDLFELNVDIPFLDTIGVRIQGGGGGGGGDGGRDVIIRSQRAVILGSTGEISTEGGKGGDGSADSVMHVNTSDFSLEVPFPVPALPGGGGGGGRGGALTLTAELGVQRGSPDQLRANGGHGGLGGVAYLSPEDRISRYQLASLADANGPGGFRRINGPLLDPTTYCPNVTSRQLLALTGVNIVLQRAGIGGFEIVPVNVRVQGTQPGQDRTFEIKYNEVHQRYEGYILLYQGFNTLSGSRLIPHSLLVISTDTDGDGLSDDDEADLGTNPNLADTDGDGLNDGTEMVSGGNPLRADSDGDGLLDGAEFTRGTRLDRQDTDGDGLWDSGEVVLGSNPLNATSTADEVPEGKLLSNATHPGTPGGAYLAAINGANGQFGLLGRPAGGFGFGLAIDRGGTLFIADGTRLRAFDPLTQAVSDVGEFDPTNHSIQCATLAFNPVDKFLYGVELGGSPNFDNTGQLLRVNRADGAATRIGNPLTQRIHALAFDTNGVLFASVESGPGSDSLVELNPGTGALTQTIGPLEVAPVNGLAFNRAGMLFGVNPLDAESSLILSVNRLTGAATPAATVARRLSGLAVMPCPAPCLGPPASSPGWFFPAKLKSFDYNGDGRDDLVLLAARDTSLSGNSVTFLKSKTNGTFALDGNYPLSSPATGKELAVARLDDNATPDVVALNLFASPASVSVFLNNNGGYAPPTNALTLIEPKSIDAGDVNGDGFGDLVVVGAGTVSVFRGDGIGGFGNPYSPFPLDPSVFLLDVRLGDVDGDGDLDIVALDSAVTLVSLNGGGGNFGAPVLKAFVYEDNGVELADVNGDGRADVVVMLVGQTGGFFVLLSQGNGQLSQPIFTSFASGHAATNPQDFTLADLNDDGLPDLVFATYTDNAVHIWLNQGDGTFRPRVKGPLITLSGRPPLTVAVGDFNGDGKPDVAAGVLVLNQIWTWLNQ